MFLVSADFILPNFYNLTGENDENGISPIAAETNALTLGESIEYAFTNVLHVRNTDS